MFFGLFFLYAMRVDLSVAIVNMVNGTEDNANGTSGYTEGNALYNYSMATAGADLDGVFSLLYASRPGSNQDGEFNWDISTQSSLLGAYFYGYIVLQIPGGWLAARFGATRIISTTMFCASICTLAIPVSARNSGFAAVFALRVLVGFFGGVSLPSYFAMWGRWAPKEERTKLTTLAFSGGYAGTVVTFATSGFLCEYGFDGGWPSIFYIIGGLSFLWAALWTYAVYDNPSCHPSITEQEKVYIVSSLGEISQKSPPTPWRGMMTSFPFWCLIVNIFCLAWIGYTFLTSLPQYIKDVLDFDIAQNGLLSAVPFLGQTLSCLLCGPVADWLMTKWLTRRQVRILFQMLTTLGIAACLLGIGYITKEHRYWGVGLFAACGFFSGLQNAGYLANFIDIAPRFVGIMYGIGNCLAAAAGFITPLVAGAMTQGRSRAEWQRVFYVCEAVCLCAAIVFLVFSSSHVQAWALEKTEVEPHEKDATSQEEDGGIARTDGVYTRTQRRGSAKGRRTISIQEDLSESEAQNGSVAS